jgi:intracellular multiplication protein IcmL
MMERYGLERVLIRNQFYWDNYKYLALATVFLLINLLLLMGFIGYQRMTWPTPKYFATFPDGRPIPVVRLNLAYYNDPITVLNWAKKAVETIYSLDYVTWRETLQDVEGYFTPEGYQAFLTALKISTNLDAIKAKQQVVSATVTALPTLIRQGQLNPNLPYSWDIQMPVTVIYQNSADEVINQNGTILMQVERASLLRHKEGIAIAQLVLQAK